MKETPSPILTAATKLMSTANPRGPRLRCGVRIASNATAGASPEGGAGGDSDGGVGMARLYRGGRAGGKACCGRTGRRYTRRMAKPRVDADAFFRRLAAANPDPRGEL